MRCRSYSSDWCVANTYQVECSGTVYAWSASATWSNKKAIKDEADNVRIPPGVIISMDEADTDVYNLITV